VRPARTILLCGEGDLSDLRFCLSHARQHSQQACYRVVTAETVADAFSAMKVLEFDLLLCQLPFVGCDRLLKEAKEKHGARVTMVLRQHENQKEGLAADCRLLAPARWDLLERIKFLTVKKRGPRRGWKAREEELCGK
jgi:DNA-binding response OmpR family regulator